MTYQKDRKLSAYIGKGKIGTDPNNLKNLRAWDVIYECNAERCKVHKIGVCPYKPPVSGKCKIEYYYMSQVLDTFFQFIDENTSELIVTTIGFRIIPLYLQLCQLSKEELVVRYNGDITYTTDKGLKKVHPIYKEIRECNKRIDDAMRMSGLFDIARDAGLLVAPPSLGTGIGGRRAIGRNGIKDGDPGIVDRQRADGDSEW